MNGNSNGARAHVAAAQEDPVAAALKACRGPLKAAAVFSGVLNVLMLSGAIYMLQVYDRVLVSRSIQTLVGLTALLAGVFVVLALLDIIRQRLLTRIGLSVDRRLAARVYRLVLEIPLQAGRTADPLQPSRDLDTVRAFVSGLGPTAFFDLPWTPLFVLLCFVLHPLIGWAVLAGGLMLFAITYFTEYAVRGPSRALSQEIGTRLAMTETSRRNAEAIAAMGMQQALVGRYLAVNERYLAAHEASTDASSTFGTISRVFRMAMQSAILGLGAYLVLIDQASPGVMIAASILMGRALAPIETAVAHWKGFIAMRQAWDRLRLAARAMPEAPPRQRLPAPKRMLTLEQAVVAAPGGQAPILHGVSLSLIAGQALGIIGPSASGKSTLARVLAGVWTPARGSVRLDGSELSQWAPETRGDFIGYLPQDIGLFDGTVAENIARFRPGARLDQVVAAARVAGCDGMIRALPEGYETRIGEGGLALSGGQRQRVALARAVFGDPFLVLLDEPNANLDTDGEDAVTEAIRRIRERNGIAIVIAHRPSALAAVDTVAVMREGRLAAFGPRDAILDRVLSTEGESR
ncbi:type I secretion system permease/ATPase [Phreatobacter sp. AB_2022a]|uniref:type I secretion system permease/ATPase n=1 Tax=Phreatobacter sp. AB_2022a TaxID=3003134 RepID=UPI002286DB1E|nr:type I secretion system permease/ATPase [Phreatobacter sp. AB_2022a]MCZ0737140.1 type I secretion system permease/ATPase [Phreatobacter sp. AB_2022a]